MLTAPPRAITMVAPASLRSARALHQKGIVNLLGTPAAWQDYGMDTPPATAKYKNHRFPVEIISHAVWLYFRFCLSFRDVEELLLERGVVVTQRFPIERKSLSNGGGCAGVFALC